MSAWSRKYGESRFLIVQALSLRSGGGGVLFALRGARMDKQLLGFLFELASDVVFTDQTLSRIERTGIRLYRSYYPNANNDELTEAREIATGLARAFAALSALPGCRRGLVVPFIRQALRGFSVDPSPIPVEKSRKK